MSIPAILLTRTNLDVLWDVTTGQVSVQDCDPDVQVLWDAIQPFTLTPEPYQIKDESRLHRWIVRDGLESLDSIRLSDPRVAEWIQGKRRIQPSNSDYLSQAAAYVDRCLNAVTTLANNCKRHEMTYVYDKGEPRQRRVDEEVQPTQVIDRAGLHAKEQCRNRCRLMASIDLPDPPGWKLP